MLAPIGELMLASVGELMLASIGELMLASIGELISSATLLSLKWILTAKGPESAPVNSWDKFTVYPSLVLLIWCAGRLEKLLLCGCWSVHRLTCQRPV